jgi:acyl phosphate:glycerol-3-phosphate acyltransferase
MWLLYSISPGVLELFFSYAFIRGDRVSIALSAALAAGAYLLGSVPFSLILGRLRGVDIRTIGSGNIGATNLTRALGRRWGIAAFALDFLKGLAPVVLALLLARPEIEVRPEHAAMACGAAAILGHVFPIYLRFRGGKGVATSFGVIAGLAPVASLAAGAAWLGLFLLTGTVSIASLAAAAVFPPGVLYCYRHGPPSVAIPMVVLGVLVALLIVVRHRSNIRRLLSGKEGRF